MTHLSETATQLRNTHVCVYINNYDINMHTATSAL